MIFKSRSTLITLLLLLIFFVIFASVAFFVKHNAKVTEKGSEASATLSETEQTPYTTIDGQPFTFSKYRSKVRVVNVWASWSPFTPGDFEALQKVSEKYSKDDIVMIAINRKEPLERIEAYLKGIGEYPGIVQVVDVTDAYYVSVGGYAMPETIVYDQTGKIVWHTRGALTEEQVVNVINPLLGM